MQNRAIGIFISLSLLLWSCVPTSETISEPDFSSSFNDAELIALTNATHAQEQCENAVARSIEVVGNEAAQIANLDFSNISDIYKDVPRDSIYRITFGMEAGAEEDIPGSLELWTTASAQIIEGCQSIGIVRFGKYASGNVISFGLVDGKISPFQCIEPDETKPIESLEWGKTICV